MICRNSKSPIFKSIFLVITLSTSHESDGKPILGQVMAWSQLARADRVRERYSLFYVGNGKGVAYLSKRMTRIRLLYCLMKRQPVKTMCKEL